MKNEKVIYWKDSFNLQVLEANVNRVLPIIQGIVDEFKKVKVVISSIDDITKMLDSSRKLIPGELEDLVFNQTYPEIPAGFSRDNFRQFAEMPDIEAVKESFEPLKDYQNAPFWKDAVYWHVYQVIDGTVEIDQDEIGKASTIFIETAETPEEIERLKATKDLCAILDRLANLAPGQYFNISGVVQFNDQSKKHEPGRYFVKYGQAGEMMFVGRKPEPDLKSHSVHQKVNTPDESEAVAAANIAASRNK